MVAARAISSYQDRTISAVRSEKARSAAGVPASAVIRSQSEDISRRFRSFISDILSAAFSRTLLFGFRLSRTDMILDISFLPLNSARRVSVRMPVGAARTPEAFQRSKRSTINRKKINGIVAALRHSFSIMVVRPLRCGVRADHRTQTLRSLSLSASCRIPLICTVSPSLLYVIGTVFMPWASSKIR